MDEKKHREHKEGWVKGADDHIEYHDMYIEDIEFSEQLVKDMLPSIKKYDPRFKKFPLAKWDIVKHSTLRALHDTVRTRISNLQAEAEKLRKQEETRKRAAQSIKRRDVKSQKLEKNSNVSSTLTKRGRKPGTGNLGSPSSKGRSTGKNTAQFKEKPFDDNKSIQAGLNQGPDG